MDVLNNEKIDLTEYLNMAQELESSIYRQERAIQEINHKMSDYEFDVKYNSDVQKYDKTVEEINNLKKKTYIGPVSPKRIEKPEEITSLNLPSRKTAQITAAVSMIVFIVGCIAGAAGLIVIGLAASIIAFIVDIILKCGENSRIKQINIERMTDYNNKKRIAEEEYQKEKKIALEKHKEAILKKEEEGERIKAKLEKKKEEKPEKDKLARQEIAKIEKSLAQTKETLSKLYSNGIIYPKYRNMAAMCTMYEYLASGRCSELTGPNGAYNLYEMEIRQNIIIVSLVVIVNDLEKIKENQYQLYQQLKQTNDLIYGVGQEMRSIYNTTKSIERTVNSIQENSYVSAECAKITAQNSEALKYISLVNAAK